MSNEELERSRAALKSVTDKVTVSKESALAFLVRAGINTPSGELTEPYKTVA
jgi:hypothetical protein